VSGLTPSQDWKLKTIDSTNGTSVNTAIKAIAGTRNR
jgi:hypothetical protein